MADINVPKFAANTVALLAEDPRRYRHFGPYWFLVKEVLKRFYTRDNLYLLGNYQDPLVIERMPHHGSLQETLAAAIETYRDNATHNMGRATFTDDAGEQFTLFDEDAGI